MTNEKLLDEILELSEEEITKTVSDAVEKFNPNHGPDGRFSSGSGGNVRMAPDRGGGRGGGGGGKKPPKGGGGGGPKKVESGDLSVDAHSGRKKMKGKKLVSTAKKAGIAGEAVGSELSLMGTKQTAAGVTKKLKNSGWKHDSYQDQRKGERVDVFSKEKTKASLWSRPPARGESEQMGMTMVFSSE